MTTTNHLTPRVGDKLKPKLARTYAQGLNRRKVYTVTETQRAPEEWAASGDGGWWVKTDLTGADEWYAIIHFERA
jgi:hypothetical protein